MTPSEMQTDMFDNLNPYGNIIALTADSPDELAVSLSQIKIPIKIIGFNSYGTKQVCYFSASGFKINKIDKKIQKKKV